MKITTFFLVVVGGVSAGVHIGLAPQHLQEWPPLGIAFVAAAIGVALAVLALALWPRKAWPTFLLGTVLGAVATSYALTRLVALPPLDPDREPLDLLGVSTSALEAAGLLAAMHVGRLRSRSGRSFPVPRGGTP
jgi:hypothetical protein